jgi:hypothetical protein
MNPPGSQRYVTAADAHLAASSGSTLVSALSIWPGKALANPAQMPIGRHSASQDRTVVRVLMRSLWE